MITPDMETQEPGVRSRGTYAVARGGLESLVTLEHACGRSHHCGGRLFSLRAAGRSCEVSEWRGAHRAEQRGMVANMLPPSTVARVRSPCAISEP